MSPRGALKPPAVYIVAGAILSGVLVFGIYILDALIISDGNPHEQPTPERKDSTLGLRLDQVAVPLPQERYPISSERSTSQGSLPNNIDPRYPEAQLLAEQMVSNSFPPLPSTNQNWRLKTPIEPGKYRMGSLDEYPPDLREDAQRAFDQMKSQGYVSVDEEVVANELDYLKNYFNYVSPMSAAEEKLAFQLDNLQGTLFDKYNVGGFVPGDPTSNKAITAARFFLDSRNNPTLKLEEWAYPLSSGGGILMFEEGATRDVNGYPTTFTVNRAPSGQAFSGLSWVTDTKMYTIYIPGEAKKDGHYEKMLALARSVPGSKKRSTDAPASPITGQNQPSNIVVSASPPNRALATSVASGGDAATHSKATDGKAVQSAGAVSPKISSTPNALSRQRLSVPEKIMIMPLKDYPPDIRQQLEQWIKEMKSLGYIQVAEDEIAGQLEYFKDYRRYILPMSKAREELNITLDNLENTPFAQFTLAGFIPDHIEGGEKTRIAKRVFIDKDNKRIFFLEERDRVTGESPEILPKEAVTNDVNGLITTFTVRQSPSGKAVSEVTWHAEQKSYTLVTPTNVTKAGWLQEFLSLAQSVPARIPAAIKLMR